MQRTVLAGLVYLALSLWAMSDVLEAPATLLLGRPEEKTGSLLRTDQNMVLATVTRNARLLSSRPWRLSEEGSCYPTPRSYALGEHMFGNGLLAALPYRLTGEPILAYNVLLVLRLWLPALAMYQLSLHFTRSHPAAFVAGLVFGMSRTRLRDPGHPYVYGDLWTPLILLFLHRLFTRRDWTSALALAVFVSLQMTESFYAVLACTIVAGVYALHLAILHWRRIPTLLPKLLLCGLPIVGTAWVIFVPYLETGKTWKVLAGRSSMYAFLPQFYPGGTYFMGATVSVLALLALLDRLRRARPIDGDDPRLALFLGGLIALWSSVYNMRIPFLGIGVRSPLFLLREVVPGLSAVRVLASVQIGAYLVAAFLAGYGALVLTERLRRGGVVLAAGLSLVFLLEVSSPTLARLSFGSPIELRAYRVRPPEPDLELVTRTAKGAVLDLPRIRRNLLASANQLLLSAFHGRPTAACYNSFRVPVQDQIVELAKKLPARPAAEALGALGFRTVFVHPPLMSGRAQGKFDRRLADLERTSASPLELVGRTPNIRAYRLAAPASVERRFDLLRPAASAARPLPVDAPISVIRFDVANPATTTFLHPEPIEPSELVVRWIDEQGGPVAESTVHALLPLAIASRASASTELDVPVPVPPGRYLVKVARASDPRHVLGSRRVEVRAPDPTKPRRDGPRPG